MDFTELLAWVNAQDIAAVPWGYLNYSSWNSASDGSGGDNPPSNPWGTPNGLYYGGFPFENIVGLNDPGSYVDGYEFLGGVLASQVQTSNITSFFVYAIQTVCNDGVVDVVTVEFVKCCTAAQTTTLTYDIPVPVVDEVGCIDNCTVSTVVFWAPGTTAGCSGGAYTSMANFMADDVLPYFSGAWGASSLTFTYGPDWDAGDACPEMDGDPFEGDP